MNKQSNTYIIFYIIAIVVVVGAAIAFTSIVSRPKQIANANADKMKQILASVHITTDATNVAETFDKYIEKLLVVDAAGNVVKEGGESNDMTIFNIDVAKEAKEQLEKRQLPVYVCRLDDGSVKYIIPMSGSGLWGAIWGYVALNDGTFDVYGAYFSHASETPGLGAEIDKPEFQDNFKEKRLFIDGEFHSISVVKAGQKPTDGSDYVDGISGGTITSKGVSDMLSNCLSPYKAYFETLKN